MSNMDAYAPHLGQTWWSEWGLPWEYSAQTAYVWPVPAVVFCTDAIQVPGTWYVIHWPLISPLPAQWENVAGLLSERLLFCWEGFTPHWQQIKL